MTVEEGKIARVLKVVKLVNVFWDVRYLVNRFRQTREATDL